MDDQFEPPAEATGQRMATNRAAPATECATCGGDRFVAVSTRPVLQTPWMKAKGITPPKGAEIEEYAPCPDCNSVEVTFRRHDGTLVKTPDTAKVRELIRR